MRRQCRRARQTFRGGGCTFAERPELAAPDARIIWRAERDPGVLSVEATSIAPRHPDAVDLRGLERWLTTARDVDGTEHAVLSDGWRHIRLDIDAGSLSGEAVLLRYRLVGVRRVESELLTLRRFVHLVRHRKFSASLFPRDRRISHWLLVLRAHDAHVAGASQRDIALTLFGPEHGGTRWESASVRSRVRRLLADARTMAHGGYRSLLRSRTPGPSPD